MVDERTPEQIALERIRDAERDGSTTLDLADLGLREVPPEIGGLTSLTKLMLDGIQLTCFKPKKRMSPRLAKRNKICG